jgi:hypothetical protein
MVQSKGTRWESQRFKIDLTGKKKYSGFSADCLRVSAAGDFAARRAMPTSGAWEVGSCGGGQSAVGASGLPLHQPGAPWARGPASGFASGVSGLKGRNRTAGRRTGRPRIVGREAEWGRTGDIAHLEQGEYFAFCSPCQAFSLFFRLRVSAAIRHLNSARSPRRFPQTYAMPPALQLLHSCGTL